MSTALPTIALAPEFPLILLGNATPQIQQRVERFYGSLAEMFEAWVQRCGNLHTQRAYRADVTAFVAFLGIAWTKEPWELFRVTVPQVQAWRDAMGTQDLAPKTLTGSCTRALRIIPLPLKPATMLRLTILKRGQGHGFTPFLLPTRSVGPRVALRHAACC
jgi:hypothetical protein